MDIIRQLLHMNPKERLTAEQALCHVWLSNKRLSKSMFDKLK